MSALDKIVTSPPLLTPRMPTASSPVVTMLNGPAATFTATLPSLMKVTPLKYVAGVMLVVRLPTLSVVNAQGAGAVSSSTPALRSPEQVSTVPLMLICTQPVGTVCARTGRPL